MRQRIKQLIIATMMVLGIGLVFAPVNSVGAINPLDKACSGGATSQVCDSQTDDIATTVRGVINILLFIVGAISVIMVIIGGILYTISAGDASKITKAKDTLLYAIVGLVVSFLAYAIVNWVITALPSA